MSIAWLAHISADHREETIFEHLSRTAEQTARFASAFNAQEVGKLSGLAHDIGKYSDAFQQRLRGAPISVDHSTAGAFECFRLRQIYAAFAVAGHHTGLPDGGSPTDNADQSTFFGRINRAKAGLLDPYEDWKKEITLSPAPLPEFLTHPHPRSEDLFFTRMLYSCLVDADFLCTEAFMKDQVRDCATDTPASLEQKLNAYTRSWYPPRNELNTLRCQILDGCRKHGAEDDRGLFTLTVPTGGGKTISSLAFALAHARKHHLNRIIYVIPYTSIIEQNAKVFREILGEQAVLEHHSGVLYDLGKEATPDSIRMAQATENWDLPVIVTTAVQFFESLYSNRSSKCRKLHNLANSVIIFDEAQMLPIPVLRPCVHAISQLIAHYGVSAVLCTATQPALNPIFSEYLPGFSPTELCPKEIFDSPVFHRVTFRKERKLTWDQLADRLNCCSQVLCIVNSRKGAQEVFHRLTGEGSYHLSTLMVPAHRQQILSEIRARLNAGLPCRVVSTSLIEAGVDVDFPAVYREEAGLDSVLQAAGRCNREGKRKPDECIVTIFQAPDPPPTLFSIPISAGHDTMERFDDISSREAVSAYFQELLVLKGTRAQDQKEILPLMEKELLPFRKLSERFKMIDSDTRTIYVPIGDGVRLIQRLRSGECSRKLFRALGKYSVSVYPNHFEALNAIGALELLEDGSAILRNLSLYNTECGLKLVSKSQ